MKQKNVNGKVDAKGIVYEKRCGRFLVLECPLQPRTMDVVEDMRHTCSIFCSMLNVDDSRKLNSDGRKYVSLTRCNNSFMDVVDVTDFLEFMDVKE